MSLIRKYAGRGAARRIMTKVLPNLHHLPKSRLGRCRACDRMTVFLQLSRDEETRLCFRCGANLRYELLASVLRTLPLASMDVLELDSNTPLRPILSNARSHTQTYFRPGQPKGMIRDDGARLEDLTGLTFPDQSLDLLVSSDVLEHVPDIDAAWRETFRVLKPGGCHLFTVPTEIETMQRAVVENGSVRHLAPPEYHSDPLDPKGILAFWHFGRDFQARFGDSGLIFSMVSGPEGLSNRIVWSARKPDK